MKVELKDRLKYAMAYNDLTAAQLSKKTGFSKSAVSQYLSGTNIPKPERIFQLALALDVSEAWLLGYDVDMARTPEQKETDAVAAMVKRMSEEKGFQDLILQIAALNPPHLELVRNLVVALPKD